MPGVRIQHPTERSSSFTLVDGSRPYPEVWTCPAPPVGCGGTHQFKTYHLRLDETGAAIVSVEIWQRLQRMRGHGFVLANEVKQPPSQRIAVPPQALITRLPPPGEVTHG